MKRVGVAFNKLGHQVLTMSERKWMFVDSQSD